jgi:hypothetical protein
MIINGINEKVKIVAGKVAEKTKGKRADSLKTAYLHTL